MVGGRISQPQVVGIIEPRTTQQHFLVLTTIIPILTPLPNVTGHIIQAITVGRVTAYYRCFSNATTIVGIVMANLIPPG